MRISALVLILLLGSGLEPTAWAAEAVAVRVEEDVYGFVSPDNGSGPLWSYGCTVIARSGDDVIVSQMETGAGVEKLCNTRWRLLRRAADGWRCFAEADGCRQREPCLLSVLPGGRLYLYVNDSTEPPGTMYGACEPHLLRFVLEDGPGPGEKLSPKWQERPSFSDHSYRGYAADAARGQLLMFNIDNKTGIQHWCLLAEDGTTLRGGHVTFPIRSCYPQVALTRGTGHIVAVGDIVEPVTAWREYKFAQTQRKWDYVFRILYYASTPDIAKDAFGTPIEIANVDATAGHIGNQDLWIGPNGDAYIVYTQREVQSALMRDKFFPDRSVIASLHLAVVRGGQVVKRRVLIEGTETLSPGCARFHETPSGTVYLVLYVGGADAGNELMPVYPPKEGAERVPIPFEKPFTSFCLASERAGNRPSTTIDVFGHRGRGDKLSYGQVELTGDLAR